jgi:hypothetical protein
MSERVMAVSPEPPKIDALAQDAQPLPPQSQQVQKKPRGIFLPLAFGGVIAGAIGFGAAQVVPLVWPAPDESVEINQALAEQAQQIADLRLMLAAPPSDAALSDLRAQLETLKGGIDLSEIDAKILALERQVQTLSTQLANGAGADLAVISEDIKQLKAMGAGQSAATPPEVTQLIAQTKQQLDVVAAAAAQIGDDIAQQAALGRILTALDNGNPYASALRDVTLPVPEALSMFAETGVPRLDDLRDAFPQIARTALAVSLRNDMGDHWTDRMSNFFKSQTGVRSLAPREGAEPDAVLSRAEAALGLGDLTAAIAELDALPPSAKEVTAEWIGLAQQRLAALGAADALLLAIDR